MSAADAVIYDVSIGVGTNTATVDWKTDVATTGVFAYGKVPGTYTKTLKTSLGLSHFLWLADLTGLSEGTTYYYRITATAADGSSTSTEERSFTTDTSTTPTISILTVQSVASGPNTIVFEIGTNTRADVHIEYGKEQGKLTERTVTKQYGLVAMEGLEPLTTYYYQVVAEASSIGTDRTSTASIRTTKVPVVTKATPTKVKKGTLVTITGSALRGSRKGFTTAVTVGCRLDYWPSISPPCTARASDVVSWNDNRIVFRVNKRMKSGPVYVARAYRFNRDWLILYAVKGPTLTVKK